MQPHNSQPPYSPDILEFSFRLRRIMNSKNFIVPIVVAVVLIAIMRSVAGLNCNVCFAARGMTPNCEVLPCNSVQDSLVAYASLTKQESGVAVDIDKADLAKVAQSESKFVCIRSVTKHSGVKDKTVASTCALDVPKFPASDKPYSAKDYYTHGLDLEADTPVEKFFLERILTIGGHVYVCDEKVGNGPNCGEKSSVNTHGSVNDDESEPTERKGKGRGRGSKRGGGRGKRRHHRD